MSRADTNDASSEAQIFNIKGAHKFMSTEMGWEITYDTFRKICEPDAEGNRPLPFFNMIPGSRKLYTTDRLLRQFIIEREKTAC